MPNRILKESICTSDSIEELSWFEEVLFYRLIVNCDDFGRFDGRISVIKNRLFPLKDDLTVRTVKQAVDALVTAGLVVLYCVKGKPILYLPTWNDHQSVRAKKSKYPSPEEGEIIPQENGKHLQADDCKCPRNPIQSSTNADSNARERARAEKRSAYGKYKNVLLSDTELETVKKEFPADWNDRIERVSEYCAQSGKTYKNYLATIRNWARRDEKSAEEQHPENKNRSYDLQEFEETLMGGH